MEIKGILVSILAPMSDHIANGGEKILGNASSIKRRPDGRVYISGQKQRHALFSALDRLNQDDDARIVDGIETYVSNGDGITTIVETDLRADLGGFLDTSKDNYSGRRTAPLTATPAVALQPSDVGRDLLIRLKVNAGESDGESRKQALATREYSQFDMMHMNFFIDVSAVSIRKRFLYSDKKHVETQFIKHVDEAERVRRIKLALEATGSLTDYANNARNATSGEPQQVLIVFDTRLSRKASRYFGAGEAEKVNLIKELTARGAIHFIGNDTTRDGNSVAEAYSKALTFLTTNSLYDPTHGADPITTEQFDKAK